MKESTLAMILFLTMFASVVCAVVWMLLYPFNFFAIFFLVVAGASGFIGSLLEEED